MRILTVVPQVFGRAKGGGERYIGELVRALRRASVRTDILVVQGLGKYLLADLDGSAQAITLGEANALVKASDLIHVHQLNSYAFDYSVLVSLYYRKPLVLTDHGGGWRNPGRVLGRLRLRFIDGGAFVSEWGANDVDPKKQIATRYVVSGGGDHLPEVPRWNERFDFGFVGRILPHKGLHVVLKSLPVEASLVVAGQARDPLYMKEVRTLAEGKNVTFLEDAGDDVVSALYRSVRYLLVPSVTQYEDRHFARPELMGLVALEAMYAGTPVIGSNVAGLGEVLQGAGQVALPPGDLSAWSAGLKKALDENAPTPVNAQSFTWDAVAIKCIKLYHVVTA
jgi:glycosyltransferase involved in cell wall biosynthesis